MRKSRVSGVGCRGFTLLELVISLTLVTVIVLIVTGAMRIGYRSIEKGEKKIESLERFRSSLSIIDAQIQSIAPITVDKEGTVEGAKQGVHEGTKEFYFTGENDSLTMTTNYSIWGGQRGYVLVTYRVEADEAGKQNLYAAERMVGSEKDRETLLFKGLDKIIFQYFFKDPTEEEGQWNDDWTDTTKLPQKVLLRVVINGREIVVIIPIRAVSA